MYGADTSSENSYGDDEESTVQVDRGLIIDQDLLDYARWNPVRRIGERFSARTQGQPSDRGSLYRTLDTLELQGKGPSVSENQSAHQGDLSAVREDQPSQAQALPVSEPAEEQKLGVTPGQIVTFSETPSQRPDFEWESPLYSNSPFTPGLAMHHAEIARQLDRGQEDPVLFTSDFAKQLETERRLSSIPMTVPQTGVNRKQIKTMDTEGNQAQAQLQPHQPQTQPPLRHLPDPNIPSTTAFVPQPQGAIQNTVRVTNTGARPKTNVVVTPAAWRDPVQDATLGSNTTAGNDTTITKINEDSEVSDMDISNFTFSDNILHEVTQPVNIEGASAPPFEGASVPPYVMGPEEQNFQNEFRMMANQLVHEIDQLRLGGSNPTSERTPPPSPQGPYPFRVPVVQLYKANSEGQRAQFDILPEEFNPKISRLPYPYLGTFGMEDLDLESTGEMILKITLTNMISKNPYIETDRLINYLNEFCYRSQAINQEYLNRIRYKKTIFPAEAMTTLENFLLATNNFARFNYKQNSYPLDEFLLGSNNWRNASANSIKPEVQ